MPYRDFLFAHPPGMLALTALGWLLTGGSLLGVRLLFIAFTLLGMLAVAALGTRLTGSWRAGLASGALTVIGLLLLANMGRTARLEPAMIVFLMVGTLGWFAAPQSRAIQAATGATFALAVLVKLTSVVPIAMLVAGDLAWNRSARRHWLAGALGGVLVGAPVLALCLREPAFREWALIAQVHRPRDTNGWRVGAFVMASLRCPVLPLGLLASARALVVGGDGRVRSLALVSVVTTFCLAVVFRSVTTYYFALALPFCALVLVAEVQVWLAQRRSSFGEPFWLAVIALAPFAALGFAEIYQRQASSHVAEPGVIAQDLERRSGPIWTMVPDFALFVGRPLVKWYFVVDSYLPRKIGVLKDETVERSLEQADTAVLYPGEFDQWPGAKRALERDFALTHAGPAWFVWSRRPTPQRETR